jgi:hypothetical protein
MHGTTAIDMAVMMAADTTDGMTVAEMTDGMTVTETTEGMTVMALAATITNMIPTIISQITITFTSQAAISLCDLCRQ